MIEQQELSSNTETYLSRTSGYIPCTTITSLPAMWLHTIPTHTIQTACKMDSRSSKSWDMPVSKQCSPDRALQLHTTYPMPTSKRRNSLRTMPKCSSITQQTELLKLSLIINNGSGLMCQIESPCKITDSLESLKHSFLVSIPSALSKSLKPMPGGYHELIH